MPTLLRTSHLRVDVGGTPAIDGLTFGTMGDHVLVLGAARALFEAATGLRRPTRGEVTLDDRKPTEAIRARAAACAPLDPPLPGSWTVARYATWSARLAGHGKATARALALESLARMQMISLQGTRLAAAPPAVRRALVLAAAMATGAAILLFEDPRVGLPDEAAHLLARAAARALDDRRTVVFAGRMPLESPLALAADEAVVIEGSRVTAQGAPAEIAARERTLSLRVAGDVESFARAIDQRGGRALVAAAPSPTAYVRVDLGPLAARDVLKIAAASNAVVLELRPFAHPFA